MKSKPSKLNPNARKWVDALRGGKFKQTKHVLHRKSTGGFCCFGVACHLFQEEAKSLKVNEYDGDDFITYDNYYEYPPAKVQKWLGLRTYAGDFGGGSLVSLNDNGKQFKTIADIIESQPEGLFVK